MQRAQDMAGNAGESRRAEPDSGCRAAVGGREQTESDRAMNPYRGVIDRYRAFLPVMDSTRIVTLLEGDTPLIASPGLSARVGLDVYLKVEGLNPTGSFKDRGMTLAITKAREEGARVVLCASTGNTAASASAYAARCGMRCAVLVPQGQIALGKLAQTMIHNARVLAVRGNFDDALKCVLQIVQSRPVALVNSLNPHRIEGQKTAAFEVCDALGDAPEYHAVPVGNAGNITAYWKGYREYRAAGKSRTLPRMLGFQAAGAAPIVHGKVIGRPETCATAIRIGNPASWNAAIAARDESGGMIGAVADEKILDAYALLARDDGLFVEPASAASVAGILQAKERGFFDGIGGTVVCTLTGHGLKDPDAAVRCASPPLALDADREAVWNAMES